MRKIEEFNYGKWIRYGVLTLQEQNESRSDSFHKAPVSKGIYAMPFGVGINRFLLGATNDPTNSSSKSQWIKDENGQRIFVKEDEYEFVYSGNRNRTELIKFKNKYIHAYIKKHNIKLRDLIFVPEHIQDPESTNPDDKICTGQYIAVYKQPKYFEYTGKLWHHLENVSQYYEQVGSWYLSDFESWKEAFYKTFITEKYADKNKKHIFATDHYEVFIAEKIK